MNIRYRRAGTGHPLLMLHGSASSSHGVEAVARLLLGGHDVIRPDLPGFGETGPRPDRDYRIPTQATTMSRFLDAIGVRNCAVAGNSLGGNIAWNLALDDPTRVDALVPVSYTHLTLPTKRIV